VEIEQERAELLRIFPDLELKPQPQPAQPAPKDNGHEKQSPRKGGTQMEAIGNFMYRHETVTPSELARYLKTSPANASWLLSKAKEAGIVRKLKRGLFAPGKKLAT
jgi:DNA-binding transcriptional ArsR family regulator